MSDCANRFRRSVLPMLMVLALFALGLFIVSADDSSAEVVASGDVKVSATTVGTWELDDSNVLSVTATAENSAASVILDGITDENKAAATLLNITRFTKDLSSMFTSGNGYSNLNGNIHYTGEINMSNTGLGAWDYSCSSKVLTITRTSASGNNNLPNYSNTSSTTLWSNYFFKTEATSASILRNSGYSYIDGGNYMFNGFTALTSIYSDSITKFNVIMGRYVTSITDITMTAATSFNNENYFQGWTTLRNASFTSCTNIASEAFRGNTGIRTVTFADSNVTIGARVFYGCTSLTAVNGGIVSVSYGTFYNSGLTTVNMPSLTSTGSSSDTNEGAFQNCTKLTSVNLPSVATIKPYTFKTCTLLTSVSLGSSVSYIGQNAFEGCVKLESVSSLGTVSLINPSTFYNCEKLQSIAIPTTVTKIDKNAFYNCTSLGAIVIPDLDGSATIEQSAFENCTSVSTLSIGNNVTSIAEYAFKKCGATNSVAMPDTLRRIGDEAFLQSGISGLTFTSSSLLESIGTKAFYQCASLDGSIPFANRLQTIGSEAFRGCISLDGISFPDDAALETISNYAFLECSSLTGDVKFGSNVRTVGIQAFKGTAITSAEFDAFSSSGEPKIDSNAFANVTALKKVVLGNNLKEIKTEAFNNCTGINVAIAFPNSLTSIESKAFYGCSQLPGISFSAASNLTAIGSEAFRGTAGMTSCTVAFPKTLETIGSSAFQGSGLQGLSFESDAVLTSIGAYAFKSCTYLESTIDFPKTLETIGQDAFYYDNKITGISFPDDSVLRTIGNNAFKQCDNFRDSNTSDMAGTISFPASLESIGSQAFYACVSLQGVSFAEGSLTKGVGNDCFDYCRAMTGTVTIPASYGTNNPSEYAKLPSNMFYDCRSLTGLVFADGCIVHTIVSNAFYNCYSISSNIAFPDSVSDIQYRAFYSCSSIAGITFGVDSELATIGYEAFRGSSGMNSAVVFPATLRSIGYSAFYGSGMTGLSFASGSGLETIGYECFRDCDSLNGSVEFPKTLTSIGYMAFYDDDKLDGISFEEGTVEHTIGNRAFNNCDDLASVSLYKVTVIEYQAFENCAKLNCTVNLSHAVTVGEGAFRNSPISRLEIGSNLSSIGNQAFYHTYYNKSSRLAYIEVDPNNGDYCSENGILYNKNKSTMILWPAKLAGDAPTLPSTLTTISEYAACQIISTGTLVLPNKITTIGLRAFYGCGELTGIEIQFTGADVFTFSNANETFSGCGKVATMTLPLSVKYANMFNGNASTVFHFTGSTSNLPATYYSDGNNYTKMPWYQNYNGYRNVTVYFDEGVVNIDANMFMGCRVQTIVMADTVRTVGADAFNGCGSYLKNITLSASLESIGAGCFTGDTSVQTLVAPISCNLAFGVNMNAITSITFIGGTQSEYQEGYDYTISAGSSCYQLTPWYYSAGKYTLTFGNNIRSIGDNMFFKPKTNISFSDSIESVGDNAFNGATNLTNINLNNIAELKDNVFYGCTGLNSIVIPDGFVPVSGCSPFRACTNLNTVTLPVTLNYNRYNLFDGCVITDYTFTGGSDGVGCSYSTTGIESTPWYYAMHTGHSTSIRVSFTDAVTTIGNGMFSGCSEDDGGVKYGIDGTVSMPGVETVAANAFKDCFTLDGVAFGSGLRTVSESAFSGCTSIQTLVIPVSVTSIGKGAFSGCTGIRTLTIPITVNSVVNLTTPAFSDCSNIRTVNFTGAGLGYNYTDADDASKYTLTPWYISKSVIQTISIADGITGIGNYTFRGCTTLSDSVVLPSSVVQIGSYAFMDCVNLTSITGAGVTAMGSGAFSGCTSMTSAGFAALSSVPASAFEGCSSLSTVALPSCTSIGNAAFRNSGIVNINNADPDPESNPDVVLDLITSIGTSAFENSSVVKLSLGASSASLSIGVDAFKGCTGLETVSFDATQTSIGATAFSGCTSVETLTIPASVTIAGAGAFSGCTGIRTLEVPITTNVIVDADTPVFSGCTGITDVHFIGTGAGIDYTDSGTTDYKLTPWYISRNSVETVTVASGITKVGSNTFRGCTALEDAIELPASVTTVGTAAFKDCTSFKGITGSGVTSLGTEAFRGCSVMTSASFAVLTAVPEGGFRDCTLLTTATLSACTSIGASAFESSGILKINNENYVSLPLLRTVGDNAFKNSAVVKFDIGAAENSLTLGESVFVGCNSLTTAIITGDVATLPATLFKDSSTPAEYESALATLTAPNAKAFACDMSGSFPNLTTVNLSGAKTFSGTAQFKDCGALTTVTLFSNEDKSKLLVLPESTFEGCTALTTINLDTASIANSRVFYGCTSLASVTAAYTPTIGSEAFRGCTSLVSASAANATSIGEYAFAGTGLTAVRGSDFAKAVTFGANSFNGCTSLVTLGVPDTLKTIGESAFSGCTALIKGFDGNGDPVTTVDLKNVATVSDNAFLNTKIAAFSFGIYLTTIGSKALGSTELVSVTVADANPNYRTTGTGILYNKGITELIMCPVKVANSNNLVLPNTLVTIRAGSMEGVELTGMLTVPVNVKTVGDRAFADITGITGITVLCSGINATVNTFALTSFSGCTNVRTLTVPTTMMLADLFAYENVIDTITFTGGDSSLDADYYQNNYSRMPWAYSVSEITVSFTGTINTIDSYMFYFAQSSSKIVSITLGTSTRIIGENAFKNCSGLAELVLPDSLVSISDGALDGCTGITEITLPIHIKYAINGDITGITEINFTRGSNGIGMDYDEISSAKSLWHASSNYTVTFAEGITSIGDYMLLKPTDSETLSFPSSMRSIGVRAFYGSNVTQIALNDGLDTLKGSAFGECQKLTYIAIPNSLTTIDMTAGAPFYNCDKITAVKIPITLNYARFNLFDGCDLLTRFTFTEGMTSSQTEYHDAFTIGVGADYSAPDSGEDDSVANTPWYKIMSKNKDVTVEFHTEVPAYTCLITSIGDHMFDGCVYRPSQYVSYGVSGTVYIPSHITEIGDYAFRNCSRISNVSFLSCAVDIGDYAFAGCTGVSSLELPNTVVSLGDAAFRGCTGMTTLAIPISLNAVVNDQNPVFYGCTSLEAINFTGSSEAECNYTSETGSLNYRMTPWYICKDNPRIAFSFDSSVTGIGDYMFCECSALVDSLTVPATITSIGAHAFDSCTKMPAFTGANVGTIGDYAFRNCRVLGSVSLPELDAVSGYAFQDCIALTDATLTSCTAVGEHAFENSAIKNINNGGVDKTISLPLVTSVGNYAFANSGVVNVTIGTVGVSMTFGNAVFLDCANLVSLNLNGNINVLSADTFKNQSSAFTPKLRTLNAKGVKRFAADMSNFTSLVTVDVSAATAFGTDGAPTSGHFRNCTSLTTVRMYVDPSSATTVILTPSMFEGCTSLSDIDLDNADLRNERVFFGCTSLVSIEATKTQTVGSYCFSGSGIAHLDGDSLPAAVTIGTYAFANCTRLTDVRISDATETVAANAFNGCASLAALTGSVMENVETIGDNAFRGTALAGTVSLPSIRAIGANAFYGTSVASFSFGQYLTSIGDLALFDQELVSVSVAAGNTSFAVDASGILYKTAEEGGQTIKETVVVIPAKSGAANVTIPGDVKYILRYAGYGAVFGGKLTVSSSVISIGEYAFSNCSNMTQLDIRCTGADVIGQHAFDGCTSLTKLTVPITVGLSGVFAYDNSISEYRFTGGSVTPLPENYYHDNYSRMPWAYGTSANIIFDDTAGSVAKYMFYFENPSTVIKSVALGSTVDSIGEMAFANCSSLQSITIPGSVTEIGTDCLSGCSGIRTITVPITVNMAIDPDRHIGITSLETINFTKGPDSARGAGYAYDSTTRAYTPWYGCSGYAVTFETGIVSIGNYTCLQPTANFDLPDTVRTIGDYAFSGAKITSLNLKSVTSIGDCAFENCINLRSVTIPDTVTAINGTPFRGCTGITSATMPITINYGEHNPFAGLTIPAFSFTAGSGQGKGIGCTYTDQTVLLTPWYFTCYSGLDVTVSFASDIRTVGDYMFFGCSKTVSSQYRGLSGTVAIPDSVERIGSYAFNSCARVSAFTFGSGITEIGSQAFSGCVGITAVALPAGIETVGSGAFSGCTSVVNITVPTGLNTVVNNADPVFGGCTGITEVNFIGSGAAFDYGDSSAAGRSYACTPWYLSRGHSISLFFADTVTGIGDNTFRDGTFIDYDLTVPTTVADIGENAFAGCTAMTSFAADGAVSAGDYAFSGCTSLRTVSMNSLVSVSGYCFYGCTKLTDAALTSCAAVGGHAFENSAVRNINNAGAGYYVRLAGVTAVGENAFARSGVVNVILGTEGSVFTEFGDAAFLECASLQTLTVNGNVPVLPNNTFQSSQTVSFSSKLTTLSAKGVRKFSASLADNFRMLTTVDISSATSFGTDANPVSALFRNCTSLNTVYMYTDAGPTVVVLPESMFEGCTSLASIDLNNAGLQNGRIFYGCTLLTSVTASNTLSVGQQAFMGSGIRTVTAETFPLAETIGNSAFENCSKLTDVKFTNSVTSVGSSAFRNCTSLVAITDGTMDSVITLGANAFCGDANLVGTLSMNSVTSIGDQAFYGTKISAFSFGAVLASIGDLALFDQEIVSISVSESNTSYAVSDGILYSLSVENNVTVMDTVVVIPAKSGATDIVIPEGTKFILHYAGYGAVFGGKLTVASSVLSIGEHAFENCSNATEIEIACDGADVIKTDAFRGCTSVAKLTSPISVKLGGVFAYANSISEYVFTGGLLSNLPARYYEDNHGSMPWAYSTSATVRFVDGVGSVDRYMFYFDEPSDIITAVTLGNAVDSIGEKAFYNCRQLQSIVIPDSVSRIGEDCLYGCSNITSLTVPISTNMAIDPDHHIGIAGLTELHFTRGTGIGATYDETTCTYTPWYGNDGYTLRFDEGIESIGDDMYLRPGVNFTLPNTLVSIGAHAFEGCAITAVDLKNVVTIRDAAFKDCVGLKNVTIPDSVTAISGTPFEGCVGISSVRLPITLDYSGDSNPFRGCTITSFEFTAGAASAAGIGFRYDESSVRTTPWYITIDQANTDIAVAFSGNIKTINDCMFCGCSKKVGDQYKGLSGSFAIPDSVTQIGERAFQGCNKITSVSFGSGLSTVKTCAFDGCSELTAVTLPAGLTALGAGAFRDCSKVTSLTVPISVNTVVDDSSPAFLNCSKITSVSFIGTDAGWDYTKTSGPSYYACTPWYYSRANNISVSFQDTITGIGDYTFKGCIGIVGNVTVPASVRNIGESAFEACIYMDSLVLGNNSVTLEKNAFGGCSGLTSLTMSIEINSVGSEKDPVFSGCTGITSLRFTGAGGFNYSQEKGDSYYQYTPWYYSRGNQIALSFADTVTSVGDNMFFGCSGLNGDIVCPVSILDIGDNAFRGCTSLDSFSAPSAASMGTYAFNGCATLSQVSMPRLTVVPEYAFTDCRMLDSLTLTQCTTVGQHAFENSGVRYINSASEISMPKVTSLGNNAFAKSGIAAASFGTTLMALDVGERVFFECTSLRDLTLLGSVAVLSDNTFKDGTTAPAFKSVLVTLTAPSVVTFRADLSTNFTSLATVDISGTTSFGSATASIGLFKNCTALRTVSLFADESSAQQVTLPREMFYGCRSLSTIDLQNVRLQNGYEFYGCTSLTSVSLPMSTNISDYAFCLCSSLAEFAAAEAVTVGEYAFADSGIEAVRETDLPKANTLGKGAYSGCTALTSVSMPRLESAGESVFSGCTQLRSVSFDSLTEIGKAMFYGCGALVTVTAPRATKVGVLAFYNCRVLSSIELNSVTEVGNAKSGSSLDDYGTLSVFYNCTSLRSVMMTSVKSIGSLAFYKCNALTAFNDANDVVITTVTDIGFGAFAETGVQNVTVGKAGGGLTSIGDQAFYNCPTLTTFVSPSLLTLPMQLFSNSDPEMNSVAPMLRSIDVPAAVTFNANLHGSASLTTVSMPSATAFASGIFMGCQQLQTVTLMDSPTQGNLVKLSPKMFYGCSKLTSINMTNVQLEGSVTDVSEGYTFYGCSSLESISIPSTTSIPAGAFSHCIRLESVTVPSVTVVGAKAFEECIALSDLNAEKASTIGDSAFYGCTTLSTFNSETGLNPFVRITSIGANAFSKCAFTSVALGPMLNSLGTGAFSGCSSLRSVVLPNSLTVVPEKAFQACPLTEIHISSSILQINTLAFDYTGASAVAEVDVYFNGTLTATTVTTKSFWFPSTAAVTIHIDNASLSNATYAKENGCFYGVASPVIKTENSTNVVLQFEDGSIPPYRSMNAVYGGKVVLPYYSDGKSTRDYYYSTTSNGYKLALFASDADFVKGTSGVSKSGTAVPVYPLMNGDSITFSGSDNPLAYTLSFELRTEDYDEPAAPEVQTVHYGGLVEIPQFLNPLANLNGVAFYRNNGVVYDLPTDTVSIFAGYYFTSVAVMSEDTMVTVVFQSKGDIQNVEVMLQSNFVLPEHLKYMETPLPGYQFAGWWSNPNQGGEMATPDTKFLGGQVWYARFSPLTFTVTIACDSPEYEQVIEMTGPYVFHVVDGNLYYTDTAHTANTLAFKGTSIDGYKIRLYMDRNANKQIKDDYGPITADRTVDLSLTMLTYDFTLKFTLDGEEVSPEQAFTINGWDIGKTNVYHTGDTITKVPYEYKMEDDGTIRSLSDGLLMPAPLNQNFALSRMYAGEGGDSDTELVFNNGYWLYLSHFEGNTSITITYALTAGLYKISFRINDDTGKVAETGDNYMVGDYITMATVRGLSKTGYSFVGFRIDGMSQTWDAMDTVELTQEMIDHAEYCVITINGVWEKLRYTVAFDLGEYDGKLDPVLGVLIGDTIELPRVTGYIGHAATSWHWVLGASVSEKYTANFTLKKDMIDQFSTADRVLTLQPDWGAKTYTLKVDPSSGVKFIEEEATFGMEFKLWDIGSYTRKYMVFEGWKVGSEGTRVYANNTTVVLNNEMAEYGDRNGDIITFFMSWKDNEYMVQYNLDGGDGTTPTDDGVYIVSKTAFHMAENLTPEGKELFYKNGYSFIGWRYSQTSAIVYNNTSGLFDSVLAQNADSNGIVTLYAVWSQKSYKITYSLDGGRTGSFAPTSALYGDEVTISSPTKAGYEFTGWRASGVTSGALCSSSAGYRSWDGERVVLTSKFMDLCDVQDGVVTMMATWTAASYIVSWDLNGASEGTIIDGSITIELGEEIRMPEVRNEKKTGYTFGGWSVDKVNPIADGTVFRADMVLNEGSNTVVFYAVWNPVTYVVQYRYTALDEAETYTPQYNTAFNMPVKTRAGHEFLGWNITGADLSTAYYSNDGETWYKMGSGVINANYFKNLNSKNNAVVSMVGVWSDLEYSIVYNANGGTGKVPVDTHRYKVGDPVVLADYTVLAGTNGNKAIIGWSLSTDNSVTTFNEFTEGLVSRADVTRTLTLYAAWIDDMVTVTVDLDGATASATPSGWNEVSPGVYTKAVNYGASTKEVMSDWDNITLTKDGYKFDRWEYGSGQIVSNITVKPSFEKVNMNIAYSFVGVLGAAGVGVVLFARLRH